MCTELVVLQLHLGMQLHVVLQPHVCAQLQRVLYARCNAGLMLPSLPAHCNRTR